MGCGLWAKPLGIKNKMTIQSKKYKIKITKDKFFQVLNDRYRLPAENILFSPFMNKNCEWVTGKIERKSFALSDYRFTNVGINIYGDIQEKIDIIEVSTSINFKPGLIITQTFFFLLFLLIFYISNNVVDRLALLFLWLIGEIGNYLIFSPIVKNFYFFFEHLYKSEIINVEQ